jgi:hypothetical protein
MRAIITGFLALVALSPGLVAQNLAQRVAGMNDGHLRLSFAARAGVCGDGGHSINISDDESDDWVADCDRGPVRVSLRVQSGRVVEASTHVGGRWRTPTAGTTDLGTLSAGDAANDLLALVERSRGGAEDLITAATLADSAIVWPTLIQLARDSNLSSDTRKHAVFWLGQAAGKAATRGLDSIARDPTGDLEVRKQAIFALSQRPNAEAVPVLINIARTNRSAELRKTALFWLGQSEDPRAIGLFEEILTGSKQQ